MSSSHQASAEPQSPAGIKAEAIASSRAIVEIQRHIPYLGDYNDEEQLTSHSEAIGSFVRKLDGFERIRGTAEARGSGREVEESTLDEEEEEDTASGKIKLDLTRLPWNTRKQPRLAGASAFSPVQIGAKARASSVLRTVETLEAINVDLKKARTNLLLSLGAPQFPESQWTRLLSGGMADFDQVISGLYASADVERATERIGGLELSYVTTTPTERVATSGDWTTAYNSFTEAFFVLQKSPQDGSLSLSDWTCCPGMYAVPMWVVPKPHSNGLHLVVDHSAGQFSLNSMIPKAERSVHLDGLQQLGQALLSARKQHPNCPLVVWKSDVSRAYRILPMHPLWQIKQTVVLDAERRVDFDNDFGGGGSGRVWSVFFTLMLWIATFIKFILDLFAYVDDAFSWDFADNLLWYEPYQTWYLMKQVKLLRLWDDLGIPHQRRKQEWGRSLTIIGLLIDANEMTITMPDQSRFDLIAALRAFAVPKHRRPLIEFQRLAGWVNWSLNVYVLLRPGLNTLYAKIRNKTQPLQSLWVSKALCSELLWIASHLESSTGVHILQTRKWTASETVTIIFTDTCLSGMAFYIPATALGFQCPTGDVCLPRGVSQDRILYFEALAVVSAIMHALSMPPYPKRIIIRTDNTNTVDMFNSLHALPPYNPLLITTVDRLMQTGCHLRVFHIPGAQNTVADALSRFGNAYTTALSPRLQIHPFSPLCLSLGVTIA
ncbi:hypothetical protein FISHEDRAFT_74617 [Fistulina hepatica ATCC 64428]|uniref:DNA/RNA polymerase n=1 Tax=Fistulina hepatica ATCC 64428 TaxID=1128425 RepID=A0A0D7A9L4_9AGAR|nr:hypothetical protein FISHEDRAFT_74617 [Fistulina hepatica ATCC 64428]